MFCKGLSAVTILRLTTCKVWVCSRRASCASSCSCCQKWGNKAMAGAGAEVPATWNCRILSQTTASGARSPCRTIAINPSKEQKLHGRRQAQTLHLSHWCMFLEDIHYIRLRLKSICPCVMHLMNSCRQGKLQMDVELKNLRWKYIAPPSSSCIQLNSTFLYEDDSHFDSKYRK